MPIMTSTVLCGSHSGDLVPDLHGSVLELGDIEILDTHVSYCDGQPDPSMATQLSYGRRTRNTLSSNNQASISLKPFTNTN